MSGRVGVGGSVPAPYVEVQHDTIAEAVEEWRRAAQEIVGPDKHCGYPESWWGPLATDGGCILGACESCERPILDGEKYGRDEDGCCLTCEKCTAEMLADEQAGP